MSVTTSMSPTISMKDFGDTGMQEHFLVISGSTVIFNQRLVESVTPMSSQANTILMLLSLRDGSCLERRFQKTESGIIEKATIN